MNMTDQQQFVVVFLGSVRYASPLDPTTEKKFRALEALGNLFIIGFSMSLRPRRFTQHAHIYALPLLPLAPLRYLELFVVGWFLTLWCIVRHRCRLIIAQSPYEAMPGVFAKIIARWFGAHVALVIEAHGDFEHDLFLQRRIVLANGVRWLMHRFAGFTLKHADALRAVSNSTRQQLATWRPDCHIAQFMAWTDMDAFLQAYRTEKKFDTPVALYTGVIIPRKGVIHLVNAFDDVAKDFPQARLVLIGREDDPAYAQCIKQRVQASNLHTQIEFVAEMPQESLARYMAQAHVFMLPSLAEGLGRVVVEAMATGTPVIGSRVGGIPDMIDEGQTGFLTPPGDEAALAEKMRWLFSHPEEMVAMGAQAHQSAQTFFSAALYCKEYHNLCDAAQKASGGLTE